MLVNICRFLSLKMNRFLLVVFVAIAPVCFSLQPNLGLADDRIDISRYGKFVIGPNGNDEFGPAGQNLVIGVHGYWNSESMKRVMGAARYDMRVVTLGRDPHSSGLVDESVPIVVGIHGSANTGFVLHQSMEQWEKLGAFCVLPQMRGHGNDATGGITDIINPKRSRPFEGSYSRMVVEDVDQIMQWVRARYPKNKIILEGYSLGAMLINDYLSGVTYDPNGSAEEVKQKGAKLMINSDLGELRRHNVIGIVEHGRPAIVDGTKKFDSRAPAMGAIIAKLIDLERDRPGDVPLLIHQLGLARFSDQVFNSFPRELYGDDFASSELKNSYLEYCVSKGIPLQYASELFRWFKGMKVADLHGFDFIKADNTGNIPVLSFLASRDGLAPAAGTSAFNNGRMSEKDKIVITRIKEDLAHLGITMTASEEELVLKKRLLAAAGDSGQLRDLKLFDTIKAKREVLHKENGIRDRFKEKTTDLVRRAIKRVKW